MSAARELVHAVRTVPKPWGEERIFAETPRYAGKLITIRRGQSLSYQYHNVKDETVHVLSGALGVEYEPCGGPRVTVELAAGDTFRIEPGTKHRMFAPETGDCVLVEVSSPELDDVIRLEDRYGRQGTTTP
ncbi:MAG TPA: cupin domain-containing protein [Thermoanaerobaculia bacterium]|nr:cupin domain-containing protein [Thermoanaerobaculia bacterium]